MELLEGHARDILVAVAVVGGILLSLYLYTGTWPPPVVVESNSMMHIDSDEYAHDFGDTRAEDIPYGRFGTIDPGDLVLVKDPGTLDDVRTYAHQGDERYNKPGEVVIYFTNERLQGTPIIHRAMTYVTALDSNGDPIHPNDNANVEAYDVVWHEDWATDVACSQERQDGILSSNQDNGDCTQQADCRTQDGQKTCRFSSDGFRLPDLAQASRFQSHTYAPDHSGFITQGDNAVGNEAPDIALDIYPTPVPFSQIQGVARAELPWFGLIKLALTGDPAATAEVQSHPYYWTIGQMTAPQDLWIMLLAGISVVALAPVGLDYAWIYTRRRLHDGPDEDPDPPPPNDEDDPPPPSPPDEPTGTTFHPPEPPTEETPDEDPAKVKIHLETDDDA